MKATAVKIENDYHLIFDFPDLVVNVHISNGLAKLIER